MLRSISSVMLKVVPLLTIVPIQRYCPPSDVCSGLIVSVELLCVIVTVTLPVLTGLPFLVQVNITGAVLNSTKHSSELVAPAIREDPMSLSDTLILGAINKTEMVRTMSLVMMLAY